MIYKLNDKIIDFDYVEELISDLVIFPYNKNDYNITIEKRKEKYFSTLINKHKLQLSENLMITCYN